MRKKEIAKLPHGRKIKKKVLERKKIPNRRKKIKK